MEQKKISSTNKISIENNNNFINKCMINSKKIIIKNNRTSIQMLLIHHLLKIQNNVKTKKIKKKFRMVNF